MGALHGSDGVEFELPCRCLIGRSALAQVRLTDPLVSMEHAVLLWERGGWRVRDLASRNGTFVNGTNIATGTPHSLAVGDRLSFGNLERSWRVASIDEPEPCAYKDDLRNPSFGKGRLLLLPDDGSPEAAIYPRCEHWICERDGSTSPAESGDALVLDSGRWLLFLPDLGDRPERSTQIKPFTIGETAIEFRVSADEEQVDVRLAQGSATRNLPRQACLYTLLTLARIREKGAGDGWISAQELAHRLRCTREKLNVDIHRIRRLFQVAGAADPSQIVERCGQELRCGGRAVSVVRVRSAAVD